MKQFFNNRKILDLLKEFKDCKNNRNSKKKSGEEEEERKKIDQD